MALYHALLCLLGIDADQGALWDAAEPYIVMPEGVCSLVCQHAPIYTLQCIQVWLAIEGEQQVLEQSLIR